MKNSDLIIRINQMLRMVEASCGFGELSSSARAILKHISEAELDGERLRLTDLVRFQVYGTLPTVRAVLAELHGADWIEYVAEPQDARSKFIAVTPKARQAFRRMSSDAGKFLSQKLKTT